MIKPKLLENILAAGVATDETDGYKRFVRALKKFNYNYEVLA